MTSEPNLWRDTCAEEVSTPPPDRDASFDLIVIGGGFTGCAAALEAARAGASVCLLEGARIGHGGSGRNVGLVNAGLWLPPEDVIARMGRAAGTRLIEALGAAPERVFHLIAREGIRCEAQRNGTLHLAHAPAGLSALEDRHRQGVALGAPLRLLDASEAARRTGARGFHGALLDPRAGTIQPLGYVRGLARAAIAAGARLHESSVVQTLRHDGTCWQVQVAGQTLRAGRILVATNAYHLGLRGPFTPRFVSVHYCQYATAPLPPALRARILQGGEGCWDTALVMSSFRMDQAGRLILGGIGNGDGRAGALHHAWARRKLTALFPDLRGVEFSHGWSGRIAMTRDHIPKAVAFGPGALACFGYSGRGIGPGTVFGQAAAIALLQDKPDALPVPVTTTYVEHCTTARALWYDLGATVAHTVAARLPVRS